MQQTHQIIGAGVTILSDEGIATPQVGRKVRHVTASFNGWRIEVVTTPLLDDRTGGDTLVSVLAPSRSCYPLSQRSAVSPAYIAEKFGAGGSRELTHVIAYALNGSVVGDAG